MSQPLDASAGRDLAVVAPVFRPAGVDLKSRPSFHPPPKILTTFSTHQIWYFVRILLALWLNYVRSKRHFRPRSAARPCSGCTLECAHGGFSCELPGSRIPNRKSEIRISRKLCRISDFEFSNRKELPFLRSRNSNRDTGIRNSSKLCLSKHIRFPNRDKNAPFSFHA